MDYSIPNRRVALSTEIGDPASNDLGHPPKLIERERTETFLRPVGLMGALRRFSFGPLLILTLLAGLLVTGGCRPRDSFRIGVAGASTGPYFISWDQFYRGVRLAAEEINAQGGVLGKTIELFPTDDQVKVDVGVSEMKKLILRDRVHMVVGGSASHVAAAQSELARRHKVPYIIGMCNSAVLAEDKGHPYLFQLTPSTRMEGYAVAHFLAQQGWKKIWYLLPDYEWGHTIKRMIEGKLSELSVEHEISGESWPKLDETDFSPYITVIQAAGPDVVINGMGGGSLISFTKQATAYGLFESTPIIAQYDLNNLKALGEEMPAGAVGFNRGAFFCVPGPGMDRFVQRFRQAYQDFPTAYAVFGYESVYIAKHAARKASTFEDSERLVAALSQLKFESPRGNMYFRGYHNQVNAAVHIGFTARDSRYPFLTYRDVLTIPAEQTWPAIDAIRTLREAFNNP